MSELDIHYKRHLRAHKIIKAIIKPFFKWWFKLDSVPVPEMKGPYLVLANHNADLDPAFVHFSFNDMVYFVASEHIFRLGFISYLLKRYFNPIPRLKGSTDMLTAREVLKRLKCGMNVGIFAEGNRSFNGLTNEIPPSIGKLAKIANVPLITYKFEGGYFTTPRWAKSTRRGSMRGFAVNIYQPEYLRSISSAEISSHVIKDLYEDAYLRQDQERIAYKGKRLAEGLETALYMCPSCKQIGHLQGVGNHFTCSCGLDVTYDVYGYLSHPLLNTVTKWDQWQEEKLRQIAVNAEHEAIFDDTNISIIQIHLDHTSQSLEADSNELRMYLDRMTWGHYEFYIKDISNMAIFGRSNIAFTHLKEHYEIRSKDVYCGRKYLSLYQLLKQGVQRGEKNERSNISQY